MESKTYEYEPIGDIKLSDDRKQELILQIENIIKKDSVPLHLIVKAAQNDEECDFMYNWLCENNITIRGINSTLEKELENYERIQKMGDKGDKTKGYKPDTLTEYEQAKLFKELNELKVKLQINSAEPGIFERYIEVRNRLTETSIRLVKWVVGTFKNVREYELEADDKIQVGTMALMNAVENYDMNRGKFSTYAVVAIMHRIEREALLFKELSASVYKNISNMKKVIEQFEEEGVTPTAPQIAQIMGMPEEKIVALRELDELKNVKNIEEIYSEEISQEQIDKLEDGDNVIFDGEFYYDDGYIKETAQEDIVDQENNAFESASVEDLKSKLKKLLTTLTIREEQVLRMRFGLEDGIPKTLEQVAQYFKITGERIRQIEAKALRKMKHPSRAKELKDFLH